MIKAILVIILIAVFIQQEINEYFVKSISKLNTGVEAVLELKKT
jgi:hypothetical protein